MKKIISFCCWFCLLGSIVMLIDGQVGDSLFYLVSFVGIILLKNKDIIIKNQEKHIKKEKYNEKYTNDIERIHDIEELKEKVQPPVINRNLNDVKTEEINYPAISVNYKLPPLNLIRNSSDFIDGIKTLKNPLDIFLGKQENGENLITNIASLPNLIIGGTVMSGKSTLIHNIIANLLITMRPDQLKLILIDCKTVELSIYNGLPHLLCPVVVDIKKSCFILQKISVETDRRYHILAKKGVKSIKEYNEKIEQENKLHPENLQQKMNYLVVIVDGLAELMIVDSQNVSNSMEYIAKNGHNAGIHLITTVSNASSKEMTTLIKSYFPTRIAFKTVCKADSRLILDENGAEQLNESGTCLYKSYNTAKPIKLKTFVIAEIDIDTIIKHICNEQKASYDASLMNLSICDRYSSEETEEYDDPMYQEVVEFAIQKGKISASLIQRKFCFGYNRAAKLIDLLEERGIIGPQNGYYPRDVLVKKSTNN